MYHIKEKDNDKVLDCPIPKQNLGYMDKKLSNIFAKKKLFKDKTKT